MQLFRPFWVFLGVTGSCVAADTSKYSNSVKLSYTLLGAGSSTAKPLAEVLYDPKSLDSHIASWTPPSTDNLQSTSSDPANSQLVRVSTPDGSSSVTTLSTFDSSLSQYIDLWLSKSGLIFSASISSTSPPPLTEEQIRQKRKEERAKAKGKPLPSPKPKPKPSKSKKKGKKAQEEEEGGPVVKVTVLRQSEGPQPQLNSKKPPQVDSEGREVQVEEVPEKSFFQKYWWVFLAATMFMLVGGGEK